MPITPRVLLVEDDEFEQMLARRAISRSGQECLVESAGDGDEACRILFGPATLPQLVLLDLKLPFVDGFEVLRRVRENPLTRRVPVIVHSTSSEPRDIHRAIDLGANSFVQKHADLEIYESRMRLLLFYWLSIDASAGSLSLIDTSHRHQVAPVMSDAFKTRLEARY